MFLKNNSNLKFPNQSYFSLQALDNEDDFAAKANSDVAQLCAECILYWRRTLSTANQISVHALLAKKHHTLRVKRFAEGFFVIDNARHLATGTLDSNYQNYGNICEMARRSKYLSSLPPLPVHCVPLGKKIFVIISTRI